MSTLVPGITDAELRALAERRRSEQFQMVCGRPAIWLNRAGLHKRAADAIYEIADAAFNRYLLETLKDADRPNSEPLKSGTMSAAENEDLQDECMLSEYLLLSGYGMECLLKGRLLSYIPDLLHGGEKMDKILLTHDLPVLFHDNAIYLSPEEESIARVISRHVVWGKYVAPVSRKDMPSWIWPADQEEKSLAIANPFIDRRVKRIVDSVFFRAAEQLHEEIRRTKAP